MQLTFLSAETPASHSPSQDLGRALLTHAATSCSPILPSLDAISPAGWSGKTSPASCLPTEDGTLEPLSEGWKNAGIMRPGECLTLSMSEWTVSHMPSRNDAGVCSLSDILETGDVPQRFFLSAKACKGILRRAGKRGKELPPALRLALTARAEHDPQELPLTQPTA